MQVTLLRVKSFSETPAGYSSVSGPEEEDCVNGAADSAPLLLLCTGITQSHSSPPDCPTVLNNKQMELKQSLSLISYVFCAAMKEKHCRVTQLSCGSESQICPNEGKLINVILLHFSRALRGTVAVTTWQR